MRSFSVSNRLPRGLLAGLAALVLAGCQSFSVPTEEPLGPRLDAALRVLAASQSTAAARARAGAEYRELVAAHLPELLRDAAQPALVRSKQPPPGVETPNRFADIEPVRRPRVTVPELHRAGLGFPAVGRIAPGGPNSPRPGYQVPLTLIALPKDPPSGCCEAALVDPDLIQSVQTVHGKVPVAMDLEAPLDATRATGARFGAGLSNLVRPGAFAGRPRIVFLEPFDPEKIPLVLVHGLLSTPRMWAPLVKELLADPLIRSKYQFWFFYYPTGQPVPLSALQLRDALDDAVRVHQPRQPMVLVGHSMGGSCPAPRSHA